MIKKDISHQRWLALMGLYETMYIMYYGHDYCFAPECYEDSDQQIMRRILLALLYEFKDT